MTAPPSPPLRVGAGAHQGKVREENQDRISRFRSSWGEIFVVADGVGGYRGGAQAAEMVVNGLEAHLRGIPADTPAGQALQEAARRTSAEILRRAQSGDPATANMGATGVLALVSGRQVRVGHAGDCRAYLLRGDELIRLTRDHTRIQQMLDRNLLSEEEARDHPDASIVTRAFGKEADLALEVSEPVELKGGDLLLLASDGLCGYVEDAAIRDALLGGGDAQVIADRLIDLALAAGGEDNVSVQVIALPAGALRPAAPPPAPIGALRTGAAGRRPLPLGVIAALLILAFLAGLLIPWSKLFKEGTEPPQGTGETPSVKRPSQKPPKPDGQNRTGPQNPELGPDPNRDRPDTSDEDYDTNPRAIPEDDSEGTTLRPAEPEISGSPTTARPKVWILGAEVPEKLRKLLGDFTLERPSEDLSRPRGFPRGRVYFRDRKHKTEAERMSRSLSTNTGRDREYQAEPWPQDHDDSPSDAEILVVLWGQAPPVPPRPVRTQPNPGRPDSKKLVPEKSDDPKKSGSKKPAAEKTDTKSPDPDKPVPEPSDPETPPPGPPGISETS